MYGAECSGSNSIGAAGQEWKGKFRDISHRIEVEHNGCIVQERSVRFWRGSVCNSMYWSGCAGIGKEGNGTDVNVLKRSRMERTGGIGWERHVVFRNVKGGGV